VYSGRGLFRLRRQIGERKQLVQRLLVLLSAVEVASMMVLRRRLIPASDRAAARISGSRANPIS
jgi:hypothetical protein